MFDTSQLRREFAAIALQTALLKAFRVALRVRKEEDGLSQRKLAKKYGIDESFICNVLKGRDWKASRISAVAEVLGLRFEFAFVDRKNPRRRFTPTGIEYVQVDSAQSESEAFTSG